MIRIGSAPTTRTEETTMTHTRKISEYTLRFTPHMAAIPGAVDRSLALLIERCPVTVTGSGVLDGTPYLRFRVADDNEATRIAAKLTICGRGPSEGKPSVASAELTTGQAVHQRVVPIR